MDKGPESSEAPPIMLQPLCHYHQVQTVTRLEIPESGPWVATLVTVQLLLFRSAMFDQAITDRVGGDGSAISLVLAELGCPACARRADFGRAIVVMAKGLAHASRVARGELYDRDFGIPIPTDPNRETSA